MLDRVAAERTDELKETRRDLLAFAAAFGVGLGLYVVLHVVLDVRQAIVTAAILLVMAGYAYFAAKVPKIRVRLDQAGDNAYYLGLLFTLTSMSFALYEFGLRTAEGLSGVEQIIGNFGIALASTVAGIFLRVFLHQMRVDPADVESMTRIELSDASKRVRANLDALQLDLGRFHDEVRQRTGDVVNRTLTEAATAMSTLTANVLGVAEANQQAVLERTARLTRALDEAATAVRETTEKIKAVEPPPAALSERVQKLADAIGTLTTNLDGANGKFAGIDAEATAAIRKVGAAADVLDRLARDLDQAQNQAAKRLAGTVKSVDEALEEVGKGLQRDRQLFDDIATSMRASSAEAVRAQQAANEVLSRLAEMTRALTEAVKSASKE